ncbi:MAG TPA: AzlD domain-containing protein [Alphaproteobacteria bacterium]
MSDTGWAALWPYGVVLVGAAATYIWRALGVALSGRIRADSPVLDLFGCIAYALLAGLVVRMIVLPVGPLQATGMGSRLAAVALGIAAFFIFRRNLLVGVATGAVTLAALAFWPPP